MKAWMAMSPESANRPELYEAIEDERAYGPCPVGLCTRDRKHPGRHMAQGQKKDVWAAWPGDHEPTVADLTDQNKDVQKMAADLVARGFWHGKRACKPYPNSGGLTMVHAPGSSKAQRLRGSRVGSSFYRRDSS